jgi:hypothetical protein
VCVVLCVLSVRYFTFILSSHTHTHTHTYTHTLILYPQVASSFEKFAGRQTKIYDVVRPLRGASSTLHALKGQVESVDGITEKIQRHLLTTEAVKDVKTEDVLRRQQLLEEAVGRLQVS